jgi:hypothetical protein
MTPNTNACLTIQSRKKTENRMPKPNRNASTSA